MTKKIKRFYLAHSTTLLKKTRRWQLIIEGKFDIRFINPFYNNLNESADELVEVSKTKKGLRDYMKKLSDYQCKGIMDRDLELIRKSDGIVAYFESPTIGTAQEIFYASYILRLPVYIISKKHRHHVWLRALATKTFKTRTEFKKYLKKKGYEKKV
jgi:nucleoside 2-deoxyribosyltransferase